MQQEAMDSIVPPGIHPRSPRWRAQNVFPPLQIAENGSTASGSPRSDSSNPSSPSSDSSHSFLGRDDSASGSSSEDGEDGREDVSPCPLDEIRVAKGSSDSRGAAAEAVEEVGVAKSNLGAESSASIIPGLTDDVALMCLGKVSAAYRRQLGQVCRLWRQVSRSQTLYNVRSAKGMVEEVLCVFFLHRMRPDDASASGHSRARVDDSRRLQYGGSIIKPEERVSRRGNSGLLNSAGSDSVVHEGSESIGGRTVSGRDGESVAFEHNFGEGRSSGRSERAGYSVRSPVTSALGNGLARGFGSAAVLEEEISLVIKALPPHLQVRGGGSAPFDWFRLPPLRLGHLGPADLWDLEVLSLGSEIYVLGGTVRSSGTSMISELRRDIWMFDGVAWEWRKCAVLEERGRKLVAACDPKSGKIFIASSDEPQVAGATPIMAVFCARNREWESVSEMPATHLRRYLHGACCREGVFYVFVIDPDSGTQWAERYDPVTRTWEILNGMQTRKAVVAVGNEFFSIENGPVDSSDGRLLGVERFDWDQNTWQHFSYLTPGERRRIGARTSVTDNFLVGMSPKYDRSGTLCVIGSWQEQASAGRRWEHKASVSLTEVDVGDEKEAGGVGGRGSRGRDEPNGGSAEDSSRGLGRGAAVMPGVGDNGGCRHVLPIRIRAEGRVCVGGSVLCV